MNELTTITLITIVAVLIGLVIIAEQMVRNIKEKEKQAQEERRRQNVGLPPRPPAPPTSGNGRKIWPTIKAAGLSPFLAIAGYLFLLWGLKSLLPVFWNWLSAQEAFFWWVVVGLPLAALLWVYKIRFGRALAVLWLIIGLFYLTSSWPNEWQPNWQNLASRLKANKRAARATDSRYQPVRRPGTTKLVTRTVVHLEPGGWSEWVSPPFADAERLRRGKIRPQCQVLVRTASGKQWQLWPEEEKWRNPLGKHITPSLRDQTFQFWWLNGQDLRVIVEWYD